MKKKIIVYTDGGARGNPGSAGSGAYITHEDGKVIKECTKSLGVNTNNFAEYTAVIIGLEAVKRMFGSEKLKEIDVEIRMDSELVQRQLSGKYQIKEETLFPLFIKIWNMRVTDFPNLKFVHIPREGNKEADRLSNIAMDENDRHKGLFE
ncbi:ribonuclease HI family protein [Candidatus Gottesmanbacteria bacterium]|nr:ribonuclease HI family protein [Candidatus Gottesmanbacteria bacterium]